MGNTLTAASIDFPTVGTEMPWTSKDGRTTVTVQRTQFTWTVTMYVGVRRIQDACSVHPSERAARANARMLAEMISAAPATPAPIDPRPVATGHGLDMSDSQIIAILCAGYGGTIRRGAPQTKDGIPTGCLTTTQIDAMHKRGWAVRVTEPHPKSPRRMITTGAIVTAQGWRRAN